MLGKILKDAFSSKRTRPSPESTVPAPSRKPPTPTDHHLEILFRDVRVGSLGFLELYRECMSVAGNKPAAWKWYRRAQRAFHLAQYFRYSLDVKGAKAECGVLRGFSALLLCRVAADQSPGYSGDGFHLVDSFEGLSEPTADDMVTIRNPETREKEKRATHKAGHFATPVSHVAKVMQDYPAVQIHKGWIPQVLSALPETAWSFVHVDVDLFEPTLACLEYFYPRLSAGGVIVNDDYASPSFPGGGKAWKQFCEAHSIPIVALDTGQAVIIKE